MADPSSLGALAALSRDGWSNLADLFILPASRFYIPSLLAAVGFAAIAYRLHYARKVSFRPGDFLRFLFPARVYRHRSIRVDAGLLLFAKLLSPARWLVFGLSVGAAAAALCGGLEAWFGPRPALGGGIGATLVFAALLVLAYDFGTYLTHRLSHRVPLLWAFHRVHHSAEELNPLTVLRKHPVYDALAIAMDVAIVAPIQGALLFLWGSGATAPTLVAVNLAFGLFGFAAATLRHSHIWLSFGPLNRMLVSPAMHQIHHSRAERHWDRNYGEVFAFWDWMFGSIYLPAGREELRFGLAEGEDRHATLSSALLEPFVYAAGTLRPAKGRAAAGSRP
jgi:sterol desaturase/sphingolipid hydroxylase (fatty acid hydroxylase superfamily)